MGTGYVNQNGYTDTLDLLIIALCRNYKSRAEAIREKSFKRRTLMEYEYINRCLCDAAEDIAGADGMTYINEIGEKIGYAYSSIDGISETEYKRRKLEVKFSIARKLHLMD